MTDLPAAGQGYNFSTPFMVQQVLTPLGASKTTGLLAVLILDARTLPKVLRAAPEVNKKALTNIILKNLCS